jgi:cell division protein FtsW
MRLDQMVTYVIAAARYILPVLALWVIFRCVRSMLREKYEPEVWGYVLDGKNKKVYQLNHWENLLGRAKSADVSLDDRSVSRVHSVLIRNDDGAWKLYDTFSRGGAWVNGKNAGDGAEVYSGDTIKLSEKELVFEDISPARRAQLEAGRTPAGRNIGPGLTLFGLTVFQAFLLLEHTVTASGDYVMNITLGFLSLMLIEWFCYFAMRSIRRNGFEVEILAFFLTTLGLSVVATSAPAEMFKQIILIIVSVVLFFIMGWWLRDLDRTKKIRVVVAILALMFLILNLAASKVTNGARNWISIGGFSLQPSELVKVAYIYVGAATLDRLFRTRNLIVFIAFSAICVIALALMGDFGTALIFFATFLVISFMRSGSIATVALAVTGAGLAGFLVLSVKPYIAQRFATWGHAWSDVYGAGYQQTRAMSAAASGGLFGKGAGAGWLKGIVAANTDMVFGVVCEELGLIMAICAILALLVLAFFAVRSAAHGRSSYYVIAACAAVSMMLVQLGLNVFGSMDILPFTGVTFPFVSKGGTSLLSCWMLLAFVKAADTRKGASFVVKSPTKAGREEDEDE